MMAGRPALFAFVCVLALQQGCASRLDFASLSAGRDAGTAEDASSSLDSGEGDSDHAGRTPGDEERSDASRGDAGVSADAQANGASPAGSDASFDPATFSCAQVTPAATFCDDFEASDALSFWGPLLIEPETPRAAGSIGLDSRAARAGRGSLLAVVDPAVPTCAQCELSVCVQSFFFELQGHQQLTIDFDMRVEQIDSHTGRRAALFQFSWGSPERGYSQHTLEIRGSGAAAEAAFVEYDTEEQSVTSAVAPNSMFHDHGFKPGLKLNEWVHVKYDLDALDSNGSGNALTLTIDDLVLVKGPLYFGLRYREPVMQLGIPFVDTSSFGARDTNEGWQVRYDNLLVRIEPR